MLDKDTSKQLETIVIERLSKMFPDETGVKGLSHQIARIAAMASVITLQEYEKLNKDQQNQ